MRPRAILVAFLGAAALLAPVAAARAAEPKSLPAEPGALVLEGEAVAATTGDVDGDGVAELVRVVRSDTNPGALAVDAWTVGDDGTWTQFEQVPLRREASVDRQLSGLPRPDGDGMLPVLLGEPVQLLQVRLAGTSFLLERVVVATLGLEGELVPCCLTLWEVGVSTSRVRPSVDLNLLAATGRGASWVVAADLNARDRGDTSDEILVGSTGTDSVAILSILGWDESGSFGEIARRSYPAESILLSWEARSLERYPPWCTSAGRQPEVAVLEPPQTPMLGNPVARVTTVGMVGAALTEEVQSVDFFGDELLGTLANGGPALRTSEGRAWIGWRWAGESGTPFGTDTAFGGTRATPLLLVRSSELPGISLLDECFAPVLDVPAGEPPSPFPRGASSGALVPYLGELPGDLQDGEGAAIFARGQMLRVGWDGSLHLDGAAALPGMTPLGLVGPGARWVALAEASPFPNNTRGFGIDAYAPVAPARVTVVPTEQIFEPEADGGALRPGLVGAASLPGAPADEVITGPEGFSAQVEVPPGSRLFVAPLAEGFTINPSWEGRADDGHAVLPIEVPAGRATFNIRAFVVTPAGHGYAAAWHVTVLSEAPALEVAADWAPLGFDVPLRGSTYPNVSVLVNGIAVPVAADGAFSGIVSAPPWPTRVVVEAVDPVGNRTTTTLSVVGLLDYRQLPWVPIIVGLTVMAGAALFLLAPRLRPPVARTHPDDGTLEEIDER